MPTSSQDWPGVAPARKSSSLKLLPNTDGLASSDGDTLHVRQAVRIVSCDTPESHYPTAGTPLSAQKKLDSCRKRLESGFFNTTLPEALRNYLLERLTPTAGAEQIEAGKLAHQAFEKMLKSRLKSGEKKLDLGVLPAGEIIDSYGRMLAYLTPWLKPNKNGEIPPRDSPQRKTFNLQLMEEGWAAFFPIYGSLPSKKADFLMAVQAARAAWKANRGVWKQFGPGFLLGYEFRLCVKLGDAKQSDAKKLSATAFTRHCVDISGMTWHDVGKFDFHAVPPSDRLWYWDTDKVEARTALGLPAAPTKTPAKKVPTKR